MSPLLWIASLYAVVSFVTFVAYGIDKRQAALGRSRISERTLHLLELFCGWPGAAVGQVVFGHKRRKAAYMVVFVGIVVLHLAAWVWCYRRG